MGLSGKYDFPGLKKQGAAGLRLALASSPYTSWVLSFGSLTDLVLEFIANWLANEGLVFLNIGAVYVNGELDQSALDRALDAGLAQVENPNVKLTPSQIKAIDDAVIAAADRALPYGPTP